MSQIIKLLTSECKPDIIYIFAKEYDEKAKNAEETKAVYKTFCRDREKSANAELLNNSYSVERINAFWAGFETALMLVTGK